MGYLASFDFIPALGAPKTARVMSVMYVIHVVTPIVCWDGSKFWTTSSPNGSLHEKIPNTKAKYNDGHSFDRGCGEHPFARSYSYTQVVCRAPSRTLGMNWEECILCSMFCQVAHVVVHIQQFINKRTVNYQTYKPPMLLLPPYPLNQATCMTICEPSAV